MTETILSPFDEGPAIDLTALTYRKRVLRPETIDYKGRKITFDDAYMKNLVNSYATKAYEQVPFTLADDNNRHTDDPERVRGDVIGLDMARPGEDPGVYANINFPHEDAAKALLMNPKLAVSCRLTEVNGKPAVKHVCGTTDARVANLGPWQAVSLSADESGEVIDLTAYEGDDMGDEQATGEVDTFDDLSAEEIDQLLADAALELEAEKNDQPAETEERELVTASLSADDREVIDLANARAAEAENGFRVVRKQLASEKWGRERDAYARDGVSPAILDLCAPILSQADGVTVDLTADDGSEDSVNAADVLRGVLEEVAGMVDLSRPRGVGAVDLTDEEKATAVTVGRGLTPQDASMVSDLINTLG